MMRRPLARALVSLVAALLALAVEGRPQAAARDAGGYRVIVNPKNPIREVDRAFLARAFLRRTRQWDDDVPIRPVDLPADSRARRRFSEEILGRSVTAVRGYWQQAIFSGRDVPPPELASDEAVVAYVARYAGAVGYVSSDTDLTGVKAIGVR
jgi:ABC-type phosphate transport system substrate-binding protein